jgi:serine/threonine protein kinase
MVGRVIKGRFKIVRKLGQGGMGAVYLAEQLGIGHQVALKFLKSEFSADREVARRFLNEAKSYARVAHPNAVALHDFGQDDDGNLFIAMEYCEGLDLKRIISQEGRLPMAEAVEVVLQVADVLANAHQKGVIHRDLKPENIMIRRGLRGIHAKVLDFGIARLMDAGTQLTAAGAISGTPRYMSPEQVEGKEVDHRADVYSLGICLFEALTGRQPFDGATITEILRRQLHEPLPSLSAFRPDLDFPELEAVLQKACAKRPDGRWPSMAAFAAELSQVIPTQAHWPIAALSPLNPSLPSVGADQQGLTERTIIRAASAPSPARPPDVGQIPISLPLADPPPVHHGVRAKKIVAAATVILAVACSALWFAFGASAPVPVQAPVKSPEKPVEATADVQAVHILEEANARISFGNGQTAFELAKLDEAETYLKAVPSASTSSFDAKALLSKIEAIRQKLKLAQSLQREGKCDQALPLFQSVLNLNPKMKDASDGIFTCRQGLVDPSMP